MNCQSATQKLESLQQLRAELGEAILAYRESESSGDPAKTEELKQIARNLKQELEIGIKELSRESNDWEYLEEEVFKDKFLGPTQIKEVFNYEINPEDIPEIPYTPEQLEQGERDGCMLILFIPITAQAVYERTKAKYESNPNNGKLLNTIDNENCWYKTDLCFTAEVPTMQWKLVPIEILPDSADKTYAMQTKELRDHLKAIGHLTPEEEQECTDEKLTELDDLARTQEWKDAAHSLVNLKINQNHRLSLSEELQRIALSFLSHKIRINERIYSWTKSCSFRGKILSIGDAASIGADVIRWLPSDNDDRLALAFSR